MNPKVFILLLNWNNWDQTKECLESLEFLNYSNFAVLLIDNGSDDNSLEKMREFQNQNPQMEIVILENGKNLGFGGGNNTGIDYALKQKIILTSPSSLLITINLILRQYQYFYQNQNTQKIFKVIDEFAKDYQRFEEEIKSLEGNFLKVQNDFTQVTSTRSNKLQLRFRQIKELQNGEDKEKEGLLVESITEDNQF